MIATAVESAVPETRLATMRAGIDPARMSGIEIGPLASPIVEKSEGAVVYIDHCDTAALREAYRNDPGVDISRIVDIDAVWGEQSLSECVGGATFDYVLASHVAEHVPDLITWLQEVRSVLRPRGELRLVLPDCRFSFDALRGETRLADLLTNWVLRARRPQVHNVLDFRLHYAPDMDGVGVYEGRFERSMVKPGHPFDVAIASAEWARDLPDKYFDVHCWVFQPRSFVRLMAELAGHGLVPFACAKLGDTALPLLEFYVFMTPCDDPVEAAASWRAVEPGLKDLLPAPPATGSLEYIAGANLRRELEATRQALAAAKTRIAGLEASTSWRVTAPIRWLRRQVSNPGKPDAGPAATGLEASVGIADVAHETILVEQCGPAAKPRWIGNGVRPLSDAGRNPFLDWTTMANVAVRAWRVRDVVLDATTMLLMKDGRIIRETNYLRSPDELASMRVDRDRLITIEAGAPVLVCGDAWSSNHYHWLAHTLPAIDTGLARNGRGGIRLAVHPIRGAHRRTLALLGHEPIQPIILQPGRQYAIPEVEFCQFTTGTADFAVSAISQAIHDRIAAAVPESGTSGRKLYVSRIDDTHRKMRGEVHLMEKLRERGFEIVKPGTMTLDQQIAIFREAKLVVGPHGAGMANIVFCGRGAWVYELIPRHFSDPCILTLAIRRGLQFWADAFESDGHGPAFLRDWEVDAAAAVARVEEIEDRQHDWLSDGLRS